MPDSFVETLAARGVRDDPSVALDATMTPGSIRARAPDHASLPRVSLSFPGEPRQDGLASDRELEVIGLLGEGGMGAVYLARQRSLDREVAIKTTHASGSLESARALCAEALVTGGLEHPGIVPVHQIAQAPDGRPVLVMKRVEGTSWRKLLADPAHAGWQPLRIAIADRPAFHLEVLRRVCEALALAHSRGIVHRDIKPENVMIGGFGEVYLVDWGIAARAGEQPGEPIVGTPVYMAPEMVQGGAVDPRTDVYLLGATLHEILTGAPPHRGDTLPAVLHAALVSAPKTYGPEVSPELAALAARAMSKDPAARPRDAAEVKDALADLSRHRASRALSRRAEERLAELRARVAEPHAESALPALYRLVAECRFAFLEAEREWAENEAVRPGLRACAEAAAAIEIGRRDPVAARSLLSEVSDPDPALVARVSSLEREVEAERAESERRAALAATADAGVDPRTRAAFAVAGLVVTVIITAIALSRRDRSGLTIADLLTFSAVLFGSAALGTVTIGRRLWANAFNRRVILWILISVGSLTANRLVALGTGIPVNAVFAHDQIVLAVGFAMAALFTFRLVASARCSWRSAPGSPRRGPSGRRWRSARRVCWRSRRSRSRCGAARASPADPRERQPLERARAAGGVDAGQAGVRRPKPFAISETTASTRNPTKRILPMLTAPAAIPPKPKNAATSASTKNTTAQ